MANFAVICAAGKGKRMLAEKNKCLVELKGKPIAYYTIKKFEECNAINAIVLVVGEGEEKEFEKIIRENNFGKVKAIVQGGKERQDSVKNGIKELRKLGIKEKDIIVINNGANPFVKTEEIIIAIKEAEKHGASSCAFPCKDTIKKVNEELMVIETLERKELWQMQTPQCIQYGIAIEAFKKAVKENYYGTDDAQLVERLGKKVKIVECSSENIKITNPSDLAIAKTILEKQSKEQN